MRNLQTWSVDTRLTCETCLRLNLRRKLKGNSFKSAGRLQWQPHGTLQMVNRPVTIGTINDYMHERNGKNKTVLRKQILEVLKPAGLESGNRSEPEGQAECEPLSGLSVRSDEWWWRWSWFDWVDREAANQDTNHIRKTPLIWASVRELNVALS